MMASAAERHMQDASAVKEPAIETSAYSCSSQVVTTHVWMSVRAVKVLVVCKFVMKKHHKTFPHKTCII